MSKLEFKEAIDVKAGKYLLSLNDKDLSTVIGKPDWNGETVYKNIEVYMKELRKWLKKAVQANVAKGFMKTKYKHSQTLVDCGRIYVKDFGVQRLTRELRGFLVKDKVLDFDMVNCHPSILSNLLSSLYPDMRKETKHIHDYVKNRSKWLGEYGLTKLDVLIAMNSNKSVKTDNKALFCLDREFKKVQKLFYRDIENKIKLPKTIIARKNQLKQNKEGKFLNVILTYHENKILQKVMKSDEVKNEIETPMFDGFTLNKEKMGSITSNEILNFLNSKTEEDGIKWTVKDHDDSIKIDEGVDINFSTSLTYEQQKEKFEENHFIIENPFMFGRLYQLNGEEKYQFYGKEKFRDLVKTVKYFEPSKDDDQEFFPKWLEDPERKSYKEVRFIPKLIDNEEIFNSFDGFTYKHTIQNFQEDEWGWQKMNSIVEKVAGHIGLLTNYDEASCDYLFKYICHMFQKPDQLPATAIMLKSKQGFGKDTLIDMIVAMMGTKFCLRTAEMDDIFGTYNVGLRDKLLLQLNEVEGKDGYSNKEKIKNIITEEKTIIREKYISQYDQTNYLRLWILSNNLNPIEISHDDRRFVVFKSHHKKPSKQYFTDLHEMINDKESMEMLYNYCMNYDISKFDPRNDRPKTEAYNNMKEHNENPLYRYMWNMFVKDGYKENFTSESCKKKKNSETIYVKSNNLFYEYKEFLNSEDKGFIKPTFKIMKTILADIGIVKKQVKIGGVNNDYYVIDKDELKDQLDSFGLDEQIEEFEDDDFEDFENEEEENDLDL